VSNYPKWRLEAGLGMGAAFLVCLAFWLGARGNPSRKAEWRGDFALAGMALAAGLVFGWAALNLPLESAEPGDGVRGIFMLVLALVVPMAAAYALARGRELTGFATCLDPSTARASDAIGVVLAAMLAATVVAAIHVALGLVFDPRYKDFPLAALSGPVAALAILAFAGASSPPRPGAAEIAAAFVLSGSAVFVVANEGSANWQAFWFALLLVLLALSALRARAAPG
jgi:glucan 1,3-beta-glucosidase